MWLDSILYFATWESIVERTRVCWYGEWYKIVESFFFLYKWEKVLGNVA